MKNPKISVCVPCYNAEREVLKCYQKLSSVLRQSKFFYEIIFAQDGSADRTEEVGLRLAQQDRKVIFISFPRRMGKGFGLRNCFKVARGKYLIVYDVDCPVAPEAMIEMVKSAEREHYDIILCRRKILNYPFLRKVASKGYLLLTKIFFHHKFKDLQAGFKLIRRKAVEKLKLESDGFVIDTELVVKALRRGFKIGEMEFEWRFSRESSSISPRIVKTSLKMFFDLLRLWLNLLRAS